MAPPQIADSRRPLKGRRVKKVESFVRSLPEFGRAIVLSRQSKKRIGALSRSLGLKNQRRTIGAITAICNGYADSRWNELYAAVNGQASDRYIPEDVFHMVVESRLNPFRRTYKFSDKNFYDIQFPGWLPTTVGRVIRGRLLGPDYRPISRISANPTLEYVVKPSTETGQGFDIGFFSGNELQQAIARLIEQTDRDLIIQEALLQHKLMGTLNPTSLNTCRVLTLRLDGEIELVSAVLRVGREGSRIDNQAAGGLACGIDANGILRDFAVDKMGIKYTMHPDSKVAFRGLQVPNYEGVARLATDAHERLPDLDIASWDIAISASGSATLIETNLRSQELNFHQFCNGPVFAPYFDYLIRICDGRTFLGIPHIPYWKI